jgi:RNA recognition motif-containing protein
MESKLYVGNLSYRATEEELQEHFAQAGTVKTVTIVKDRETGRARGFAFVEMDTEADAQKAISMFNGATFMERALTVNLARPREERSGGAPRGGGGGGFGRRDDRSPRGGGGYDRRR